MFNRENPKFSNHKQTQMLKKYNQPLHRMACSGQGCKVQIDPSKYHFKHTKLQCQKPFCFWCVLKLYKKEVKIFEQMINNKKIKDKVKKQIFSINMPCCPGQSQFQLNHLEEFLKGCPFDGKICKSAQKYSCADNLLIGSECWESFLDNFQDNIQNQRILNKIKQYGVINCIQCKKEINHIISPQDYQKNFNICISCYSQFVTKDLKITEKPNFCSQCLQPQLTSIITRPKVKTQNKQFLKRKFRLAMLDSKPQCHLCIYKHWIMFCDSFNKGKITFEQLVKFMANIQKNFSDKCLTCGCETSPLQNVFPFIDRSPKDPYRLMTFLCGICYKTIDQNLKQTKNVHQFKKYMYQKDLKQAQAISKSKDFIFFRKQVLNRIKFLQEISSQQELMLEQKEKYYSLKKLKQQMFGQIQSKGNNQKNQQLLIETPKGENHNYYVRGSSKQKNLQKSQNKLAKKRRSSSKNKQKTQTKKELAKPIKQTKDTEDKYNSIKDNQEIKTDKSAFDGNIVNRQKLKSQPQKLKKQTVQKTVLEQSFNQSVKDAKFKRTVNNLFGANVNKKQLTSKTQSTNQLKNFNDGPRDLQRNSFEYKKQKPLAQKIQKKFIKDPFFASQNTDQNMDQQSYRDQKQLKIEMGTKIVSYQDQSQQINQEQDYESSKSADQTKISTQKDKQHEKQLQIYKDPSYTAQGVKQYQNTVFSPRFQTNDKLNMREVRQLQLEKQMKKNFAQATIYDDQYSDSESHHLISKTSIQQPINLDFDYKLNQYHFKQSKNQKFYEKIDFNQKLQTIIKKMNVSYSDLLKDLKLAQKYEEFIADQKKEKMGKSINQLIKHSCKNNQCLKSQQQFLFIEQYCFSCFNMLLVGKTPEQNFKPSQNHQMRLTSDKPTRK